MDKTKLKAYLAWAATCVVWGTTYLVIKIGVTDLPPMLFAGVRWIISGVLLLSVMLLRGHKLPTVKDLPNLAIAGLLMLGVANGGVVVAEIWLPSGLTALIITTLPFWAAIMESMMPGGVRLNLKMGFGLLLGFLGVALIFYNDLAGFTDSSMLLGVLLIFIGMLSWAGGSMITKYKKLDLNHLVAASSHMLFAGLAQTLLGFILGEHNDLTITTNGLFAIAYLTLIGSMAGYGSYMYAIQHLPVSFVSTYAYINPIIALFLGWLVLGEHISIEIIFAAVFIFTGVWIVRKGTMSSTSDEEKH